MPYTNSAHGAGSSSEELRRRIPGWGVDLDHKDRPAVPREWPEPEATGAHWPFPPRQPELSPRERSIEHEQFPPVFGTSVPLKGLSGRIRRVAYERYSEGRAAHWLLLILGDRVDAIGSHVRSFVTLRPDNPVTETGVLSEFRRHGFSSRFRARRADRSHLWFDPIIVAGPWVLAGAVVLAIGRRLLATDEKFWPMIAIAPGSPLPVSGEVDVFRCSSSVLQVQHQSSLRKCRGIDGSIGSERIALCSSRQRD